MKRSFLAAQAVAVIACSFLAGTQSALASVPRAPLPIKIAQLAKNVAVRTDTVGRCYAAVKNALRPVGVELTGGAAWMAQSQLLSDNRFQVVSKKALMAGDILVHGKSSKHPYGHIAVYLGGNNEASDHVQKVVIGGSYGTTMVFRARGKSTRLQVARAKSAKQLLVANATPLLLASRAKSVTPASVSDQEALAHAVAVARNRFGASEALHHAVSVAKPVLRGTMLAAMTDSPRPKSYWSEVALSHQTTKMLNQISVQNVQIDRL